MFFKDTVAKNETRDTFFHEICISSGGLLFQIRTSPKAVQTERQIGIVNGLSVEIKQPEHIPSGDA